MFRRVDLYLGRNEEQGGKSNFRGSSEWSVLAPSCYLVIPLCACIELVSCDHRSQSSLVLVPIFVERYRAQNQKQILTLSTGASALTVCKLLRSSDLHCISANLGTWLVGWFRNFHLTLLL